MSAEQLFITTRRLSDRLDCEIGWTRSGQSYGLFYPSLPAEMTFAEHAALDELLEELRWEQCTARQSAAVCRGRT